MPVINKSIIVPYSPEQMYTLVNDIENYREFIPWCTNSEIVDRKQDEIRAKLSFSGGGISKSFTTLNRLLPYKMIELRLVDGPFKQLEGFWTFDPHENNSCKIVLNLEFEFSNRLLAMMFGPVFNQVAVTLVDAFKERAEVVYK